MNPMTPTIQSRIVLGAAATLVSTVVLSSVLWLFAGTGPMAAAATPQVLISQNDQAGAECARVR